ncbi:MAG: hypothetical protein EPN38_10560 [Rhodanobacteraceae bacterium]|nr:MAG: hypothetical protein EPN38_10560 [Rhodanobacteraceae bacterium]
MKRNIFAIVVCASLGVAAAAIAGGPPVQSSPTRAEIQQKAMQDGPATGQIGYRTYRAPAPAKRAPQPVNPKLMRPLTQREVGMLLHACAVYPECKTSYEQAHERYQAQLRAAAAAEAHD